METIRALGSALWQLIVYIGTVIIHIAGQVVIMFGELIGSGVKKGVDKVGEHMSSNDDDSGTSIRR